ncbi:amidase signature domain-containing protein [Gongronella butleri]|nr:amidase signature domain-containing protein [Gongronella butleri]
MKLEIEKSLVGHPGGANSRSSSLFLLSWPMTHMHRAARIRATRLRVASRPLSTLAWTECYDTIQAHNAKINAFVSVQTKTALQASNTQGSLQGVPVAVKDNFCTVDLPTTCGSKMLQNFTSPYDATVVQLLRDAGAKIMGKTNMDEFGMGSANMHSQAGPVRNPFAYKTNPDAFNDDTTTRVAGGSSGGSAAAVAMDMCAVALGSDTGGSVRLPAAYCGVYGFKPSYGQISRHGLVAYANSLDTVGLLGKSIRDIDRVYDVLAKHDAKDPTSNSTLRETVAVEQEKLMSQWTGDDLKGLRVGVPSEYFVDPLSEEILSTWRRGIQHLKERGASVVPVSLPHTKNALASYYIIALAEASSNLARFDGIRYGYRSEKKLDQELIYADTRTEGFGDEVQRRILLGTHVLTAGTYETHFLPAQQMRQQIVNDFDRVFLMKNASVRDEAREKVMDEPVHVLLTPCSISTAPTWQQARQTEDRSVVDEYVTDVMTVPASLAGVPAVAFPAGTSAQNGFPIGLQMIAPYGFDKLLLHLVDKLHIPHQ